MWTITLERVGDSVLMRVTRDDDPNAGYTLMLDRENALLLARKLTAAALVAPDSLDEILEQLGGGL